MFFSKVFANIPIKVLSGIGLFIGSGFLIDHYFFCNSGLHKIYFYLAQKRVEPKDRRGLLLADVYFNDGFTLGLNESGYSWFEYWREEDILNRYPSIHCSSYQDPKLLLVKVPDGDSKVFSIEAESKITFWAKNLIVEKSFPLKTTEYETLVENGVTKINKDTWDRFRKEIFKKLPCPPGMGPWTAYSN